jgi:hypothetical protein
MKLLARIEAPFAGKVVRQYGGYTYFENAITTGPAASGATSITNSCERAMSLMGRSGVRSIRIDFGGSV